MKTKRNLSQNKNNFESIKFLFSLSSTTYREEKNKTTFVPKKFHGFH